MNDTHTCIVAEKIQFLFNKINSFHPDIQFTFELEKNNAVPFLDVFITSIDNNEEETRYQYQTSISIETHMQHQTGKSEHCKIYSNKRKLLISVKPC